MKTCIILLTLISVFYLNAAEINLNSGDSIFIEAHQKTIVTCDGDGHSTDCGGVAQAFKDTLNYCYNPESGSYCASQHWPDFKRNYPNCKFAGVKTCLEYCSKDQSGSYCANLCR